MDLQVLLPILMSWAVYLSDYPMPAEMPQVKFEPHRFFVDKVCAGKECNAVGWYNDERVIYIDEKYRNSDASFATNFTHRELAGLRRTFERRFAFGLALAFTGFFTTLPLAGFLALLRAVLRFACFVTAG